MPLKKAGEVTLPRTTTSNPAGRARPDHRHRRGVRTGRQPGGVRTYADAFEWDVTDGDVVAALTAASRGSPRCPTSRSARRSPTPPTASRSSRSPTTSQSEGTKLDDPAATRRRQPGRGGGCRSGGRRKATARSWIDKLTPGDITYLIGARSASSACSWSAARRLRHRAGPRAGRPAAPRQRPRCRSRDGPTDRPAARPSPTATVPASGLPTPAVRRAPGVRRTPRSPRPTQSAPGRASRTPAHGRWSWLRPTTPLAVAVYGSSYRSATAGRPAGTGSPGTGGPPAVYGGADYRSAAGPSSARGGGRLRAAAATPMRRRRRWSTPVLANRAAAYGRPNLTTAGLPGRSPTTGRPRAAVPIPATRSTAATVSAAADEQAQFIG